ncbi:hypothetical protein PtB15_6B362 [Puccinia triticina]|nr:hypothetical protein PtB15_6B362 [Puccinia triticina]
MYQAHPKEISCRQLINDTAAPPVGNESLVWLPNQSDEDILRDVKTFRSEPSTECNSSGCFGSWQLTIPHFDRSSTQTEQIKHFKKSFSKSKLDKKIVLVHRALKNLVEAFDLRWEDRIWWSQVIASKMDGYRGLEMTQTTMLYGFYTLLLQHYENQHFCAQIEAMVQSIMTKLRKRPSTAQWKQEWAQELLHPEKGLSENFLNWNGLSKLIRDEPRLKDIVRRISDEDQEFIKIADDLVRISNALFWVKPPNNVSAQTRVAAIALLNHLLMAGNKDSKSKAAQFLSKLVQEPNKTSYTQEPNETSHTQEPNETSYRLFNYERKLVEKVLKDFYDKDIAADEERKGHVAGVSW